LTWKNARHLLPKNSHYLRPVFNFP
jgi:hypothetical protein